MIPIAKNEREALDQLVSIIEKVYPNAEFGDVKEGDGGSLTVEVFLRRGVLSGAEPVHQAANDVMMLHEVSIVPLVKYE
jgi:hypothetical protein